jgi:hypothetical protein
LGSIDYQAMNSHEMTQVTGEAGGKRWRRGGIVNRNTNTNTNTACAAALAVCAGDDITVTVGGPIVLPPLPPLPPL